MKGDFSRLTGHIAKTKHYNNVYKQQGRVQLDSDWNELMAIIADQRKTRAIDTIGQCGAPIHNSGFQIRYSGNGFPGLFISSGRFYAGGLLCETTPHSKLPVREFPTGNSILLDDAVIDGFALGIEPTADSDSGDDLSTDHQIISWVQITTKEHPEGIIGQITQIDGNTIEIDQNLGPLLNDHHPYLRPLIRYDQQVDWPDAPAYSPAPGRTDLVYLDVWERHISVVEDSDLREVALGGPDTDTRSKVIAQVKVLENIGGLTQCPNEIQKWNERIKPPDGRLSTDYVKDDTPTDVCELGESSGYHGLENRLYRVEIHDVDTTSGTATFKWSRENAAHAFPIREFTEETGGTVFQINLTQQGKDDRLKIKNLDYVEIAGDETELDTERSGIIARVIIADDTTLTLDTDISSLKGETNLKVRRWDISNHRLEALTEFVPGTNYPLEDGIQIRFSGQEFRIGDYWVFAARTLDGNIEQLVDHPPFGIQHHYCKLALVHVNKEGEVFIEDCRPEFPPLTEVGNKGCCTVTVGNEVGDFQDIQLAIDSLKGMPGTVCIKPGVYMVDESLDVHGVGITIKSCGGPAIIINHSTESQSGIIFQVRNSWNITIEGLWCLNFAGDAGILVNNSISFHLQDCMLMCANVSSLSGAVNVNGYAPGCRITDNFIYGKNSILFGGIDQKLTQQNNIRIERNILAALDFGIIQLDTVHALDMEIIDNMITGIPKGMITQSFLPESWLIAIEEKGLYSNRELERIKKERKKGDNAFAAIQRGDTQTIYRLNQYIKTEAEIIRGRNREIEGKDLPTTGAAIGLFGTSIDVNILDNILVGSTGCYLSNCVESTVHSNMIGATQKGVELGDAFGIDINNNTISTDNDGIHCSGTSIENLSIISNRIISQLRYGISLLDDEIEDTSQLISNLHIQNNSIEAEIRGISIVNSGILLLDFSAVDNTITRSQQIGIALQSSDETDYKGTNEALYQRVIQRNSINVNGSGIFTLTSNCKILDNDIISTGKQESEYESSGIGVGAGNCIIANNVIRGIIDPEEGIYASGGIVLLPYYDSLRQIEIRNNEILGGTSNGISIQFDIDGLTVQENHITGMGLNGIAVSSYTSTVNNLTIKDNLITNCLQLVGSTESWWKYAGIVLTKTTNTQITGNIIRDNGSTLNVDRVNISALYAEQLERINISDNQFINNEVPGRPNQQAVIHIPISNTDEIVHSDINITNNFVKGSASKSLILGSYICSDFDPPICYANIHKAVITGNHFEASYDPEVGPLGPIVQLQMSVCMFASNFVGCRADSISGVSIGYGWYVMANANIVSSPITGAGGIQQQIVNNIEI